MQRTVGNAFLVKFVVHINTSVMETIEFGTICQYYITFCNLEGTDNSFWQDLTNILSIWSWSSCDDKLFLLVGVNLLNSQHYSSLKIRMYAQVWSMLSKKSYKPLCCLVYSSIFIISVQYFYENKLFFIHWCSSSFDWNLCI